MAGGRPTLYDPAYCEVVVDTMREGKSLMSVAAKLGVSRATLNVWGEAHPEFLDAVARGKALCAEKWEEIALANAMTGQGNATLTVFGLKNMARDEWRDRQEVEHTGEGGGPVQIQAIRNVIVRPK